ncbi:MAG: hypothetical protein AAGA56_08545, partial [Myxococcota bacterium]
LERLLSVPGVHLVAPHQWSAVRHAIRWPEFGRDYTSDHYPQEAGLEALAVSFNKGCYLGQEAVFMLQKRGKPPKRLVRFSWPEEPPTVGDDVMAGDKKAGLVTSFATVDGETSVMAMMKSKFLEADAALRVNTTPVTAEVLTPAFIAEGN